MERCNACGAMAILVARQETVGESLDRAFLWRVRPM